MKLIYSEIVKEFQWVGDYSTRQNPKGAGFRWDPLRKVWFTTQVDAAAKLLWAADPDCKKVIEAKRQAKNEAVALSRSADCDAAIPAPEGCEYLRYQKAGIVYASKRTSTLIADEPGLGKTIQAIGVINLDETVKTVLVVCPASLKLIWQRECRKWLTRKMSVEVANGQWTEADVVIVNYDVLRKYRAQIHGMEWDLLVLDEAHYCFPATARVAIESGNMSIGEIVDGKKEVSVLSCNLSTNEVYSSKVVGWHKYPMYSRLVEVRHEYGKLVCTEDHRVWTDSGYVEAGSLTCGANLRILQEEVLDSNKGKVHGKILFKDMRRNGGEPNSRGERTGAPSVSEANGREDVRVVQEKNSYQVPRKGDQDEKVLFKSLCGVLEGDIAGSYGKNEEVSIVRQTGNNRKQEAGGFFENEAEQSYVESCKCRKDEKCSDGKNISFKRRKWREYQTTESNCRGFAPANGIPHTNKASNGSICFSSDMLQSGCCRSKSKNGDRSGWENSQIEKMDVLRQEKGSRFVLSRVEGITIYERGSRQGTGQGFGEDSFVYCLSVQENENFFADGVLVSNCKNAKSQRTVEIFGKGRADRKDYIAPIKARRRLALTGTPIVNRPAELWNLIHAFDPQTWRSWKYFVERYCGAFRTRWGWDVSGATNLLELQEKLRSTIMVRRLKQDVLTELPPKRRKVMVLSADGYTGAIEHERSVVEQLEAGLAEAKAAVELAKVEGDNEYQEAVSKLQQAEQVAFTEMSQVRHETAIAKAPVVVETCKDLLEEVGKLVIFAHHHDVVAALMAGLAEYNPVKLTGECSGEEKQQAIDRFQGDDGCRVFVGSITAAGLGITLTAASTVLFAELDWVPGNVSQAEDRCHRIGQHDHVLVYHVVLDGSIDAKLAETIVSKQYVIDKALDKVVAVEQQQEPVEPMFPVAATKSHKQQQIEELAGRLLPAEVETIHECLRRLAGSDQDHARVINGVGFNKIDGLIGHRLADCLRLSPKQAALGLVLCRKYKGQVPEIERVGA